MQNIGVFFGGKSPEHDVSIITGEWIISGLKKLGYEVTPVYIGKDGEWFIGPELGQLKFFKGVTPAKLKPFSGYQLDFLASQGELVFKKSGFFSKPISINLAFPAFHGPNGEDGTFQGLFEIAGLAYVGPGVAASAISMDKVLTKIFFQHLNVPTPDFLYFSHSDWLQSKEVVIERVAAELSWPVFVKPAHLGSSIGINKAANIDELKNALEIGFRYDSKVLVEAAISNLVDLTCAVLGGGRHELKASLVQESVFSKDLLSYDDKYLKDGGTQLGDAKASLYIPARIDDSLTKKIQDYSKQVFSGLELSGNCRIDFLFDSQSKKVYANEINPLPGTLYHHLWEKSGLTFPELLEEMLSIAKEEFEGKKDIIHTFSSSILDQANSLKLQKPPFGKD